MAAYDRPETLEEALDIRAARPVEVLAGGTDIYPARANRIGWGDMRQADILDISGIDALKGIAEMPDHYRFGALVTWSELIRTPLTPAFDGYKLAAREVGGMQIQNRGTLVGNICTASPAGDGMPCLLSLDASVELASQRGVRTVPVAHFIDGYRSTVCAGDELVTAILVAKPDASTRGHFIKLGARRYLVISIAMAAGVVATDAEGTVTGSRLAVGACSAVAMRLPALEAALVGCPLANAPDVVSDPHFAALAPIDDVRGSAAYRRVAARELVHDLLADLAGDVRRRAA